MASSDASTTRNLHRSSADDKHSPMKLNEQDASDNINSLAATYKPSNESGLEYEKRSELKNKATIGKSKNDSDTNIFTLLFLVLGIYASFLSWGLLQERITTTAYEGRYFRASHALAALQSLFASIAGYLMLKYKQKSSLSNSGVKSISLWPSKPVLQGYLFIASCQAVSTPLAYSSLKYVDYVTMLLAKSCKLVPVMAVYVVLYRTRFPGYKYIVVALVSIGVSMFSAGKAVSKSSSGTSINGYLLLLGALILDGVYNTAQDNLFKKYRSEISGPQMMAVLNFFTTLMSTCMFLVSGQVDEVLWFARNHPSIFLDIFVYGICGAIGQVFVFLTLEKFGSIVLVTTTVTRKMFSMLLSVILFNHKLTKSQWIGVGLVFLGIGYEALYKLKK